MGVYINPKDATKEEWLTANAEMICWDRVPEWNNENLPVCLVDNGAFTAAGVAFDARELEAFTQESDYRPKCWFVVKRSKLEEVEPELKRKYYGGTVE